MNRLRCPVLQKGSRRSVAGVFDALLRSSVAHACLVVAVTLFLTSGYQPAVAQGMSGMGMGMGGDDPPTIRPTIRPTSRPTSRPWSR